ncbi:MAG: type II toxin-antitoxin system MqsA family antitoxin [Deltaproteobacteria bacterium]|nr:type II toxin-antitoxin system MqsA family antitoxin [Deltaproteobacteria bacterium]
MQCPSCGSKNTVHEIRDEIIRYKGESITVHGLTGDRCLECNEVVFDAPSYDRYREASDSLIASVNKRNAPDIRRIRKKLGLTQVAAAQIFGGGATAFSRYERGETQPPLALTKLLLVLDKHPELLKEVR